MKTNFLNIPGVQVLSKEAQKQIIGQGLEVELEKCGCSCSGAVTGPAYCATKIACLQVYTCNDAL